MVKGMISYRQQHDHPDKLMPGVYDVGEFQVDHTSVLRLENAAEDLKLTKWDLPYRWTHITKMGYRDPLSQLIVVDALAHASSSIEIWTTQLVDWINDRGYGIYATHVTVGYIIGQVWGMLSDCFVERLELMETPLEKIARDKHVWYVLDHPRSNAQFGRDDTGRLLLLALRKVLLVTVRDMIKLERKGMNPQYQDIKDSWWLDHRDFQWKDLTGVKHVDTNGVAGKGPATKV